MRSSPLIPFEVSFPVFKPYPKLQILGVRDEGMLHACLRVEIEAFRTKCHAVSTLRLGCNLGLWAVGFAGRVTIQEIAVNESRTNT